MGEERTQLDELMTEPELLKASLATVEARISDSVGYVEDLQSEHDDVKSLVEEIKEHIEDSEDNSTDIDYGWIRPKLEALADGVQTIRKTIDSLDSSVTKAQRSLPAIEAEDETDAGVQTA